jgi:putative ABC transport system permease protein
MTWLSKFIWAARERLRTAIFRDRVEVEMDEELRFHLDMETEKLVRSQGLTPEESRRRAGVAFGGVERFKEDVRDARGLDWLAGLRLDFALGVRMLLKYPALTIVGGLGMAVGIAISVGFFAFVGSHIDPKIPLDEGDRIIALENRDVDWNNEERRSLHDFVLWRTSLKSVQSIGAFRSVERNLIPDEGLPEPVLVAEMSAAGFQVARVPPIRGRYLIDGDEERSAPPVVVIGYDVWRNRFASDSAIIGRPLRLDRTTHTIVGVMPEGFGFPHSHRFWIPLRADPAAFPRRAGPAIYIFGRLAPGASMEAAQAELTAVGRRTAAAFPQTNEKLQPMVMPYIHSVIDMQGTTTWMILQMRFMMTLLLLVVALNVSVLVYARTATRQGEIAIRTALGASRRRIVAQLFTEALVLAMAAAVVGLVIARFGVRLGYLLAEEGIGRPFWVDYSLQPMTVLFAVGTAVVAAVIVGVLPALQATGRHVHADLRQLGGGTALRLGRTWTALVVGQVAMAVAALPAASTVGWEEVRNALTRPIFPAKEYLKAGVAPDSAFRASNHFSELIRRLADEPEVAGVTYWASLPFRAGPLEVEGVPSPVSSPAGHRVRSVGVGPGYLDLYGARMLAGRAFGPGDFDSLTTAVIVNQAFARQTAGGRNALGLRIRQPGPSRTPGVTSEPGPWYEIVGVAEDLESNAMNPDLVAPAVFYPVAPAQARRANNVGIELRVRAPATPTDFGPKLRQIAVTLDPGIRIGAIRSVDELERENVLAVRLIALALGLVLGAVFLLSAAGVYALTSFTVLRRRREIGIRAALGAHPRQVMVGIFSRVARQIGVGLALGIGTAVLLDRLSGGTVMDGRGRILLPTFAVIMVLVALLGALGPARRGLRIEPTEALRGEH